MLLFGMLCLVVTLIIGLFFFYGDYAERAVKYRTLAAAFTVPVFGGWILWVDATWKWNPLFYCAGAILALLISGLNDVRSDFLMLGKVEEATEENATTLCKLRLQLAACQDAYRKYEAALDGERTDKLEHLFADFRSKVTTLKQATDAPASQRLPGRRQ